MPGILRASTTSLTPADYVNQHARILREFSHLTQDSGNVSWLLEASGTQLFVKTAGTEDEAPPGAPKPYFDHAGRVSLLRDAVEVARSCTHPALPALLNVIESPVGPMLIYEAAEGELIGTSAERREEPTSAYQRFGHLPAEDMLGIFDTLIDLHRELADRGWVAHDLYDGCLIVNFADLGLRVIDLDNYRRGPTLNDMGRMFGSTRFMAPEEFTLGATIDQRTTVFNLGRLVWHFATRLTEQAEHFCGSDYLAAVTNRAIRSASDDRYPTVAAFADAWRSARDEAEHTSNC